jgi:hypothetical protein
MWSQVVRHWLWFSSPVICQFNWFSSYIQLFPSNQILVTIAPPDTPLWSLKVYTLKLNCLCTWRHWTFPDNTRQWCPVSPSSQVVLEPGRRMERKLPAFSILDSCVWYVSTSFQHTIDFLCCLLFETLPNKVPH